MERWWIYCFWMYFRVIVFIWYDLYREGVRSCWGIEWSIIEVWGEWVLEFVSVFCCFWWMVGFLCLEMLDSWLSGSYSVWKSKVWLYFGCYFCLIGKVYFVCMYCCVGIFLKYLFKYLFKYFRFVLKVFIE